MQFSWSNILEEISRGNIKALARCISLVENKFEGYETFLQSLLLSSTKIIDITGLPGAGKSTLADVLIGEIIARQETVGVEQTEITGDEVQAGLMEIADVFTVNKATIKSLYLKKKQKVIHKAARWYYLTRNFLYIEKKHGSIFKDEIVALKKRQDNYFSTCLFYGNDTIELIKNVWKAKSDFKKSIMGKRSN